MIDLLNTMTLCECGRAKILNCLCKHPEFLKESKVKEFPTPQHRNTKGNKSTNLRNKQYNCGLCNHKLADSRASVMLCVSCNSALMKRSGDGCWNCLSDLTNSNTTNLCGECLSEFTIVGGDLFKQSFIGDTNKSKKQQDFSEFSDSSSKKPEKCLCCTLTLLDREDYICEDCIEYTLTEGEAKYMISKYIQSQEKHLSRGQRRRRNKKRRT